MAMEYIAAESKLAAIRSRFIDAPRRACRRGRPSFDGVGSTANELGLAAFGAYPAVTRKDRIFVGPWSARGERKRRYSCQSCSVLYNPARFQWQTKGGSEKHHKSLYERKRRDKVMKICRRIAIQRILTHRFK
jgi:hypothetical protein